MSPFELTPDFGYVTPASVVVSCFGSALFHQITLLLALSNLGREPPLATHSVLSFLKSAQHCCTPHPQFVQSVPET